MPTTDTSGDFEDLNTLLTNSVRRLVDTTIRTEVGPETIASVRAKIDEAADQLSQSLMPESFGVQQSVDGRNLAWGNAVVGVRNALAPPLIVHHEANGRVWAEATLGAAYEGPEGHVHGGVCAMILDHVLGATAHRPGQPAVTGTLTVRYEAGTPLGSLRAEAYIDRVEGPKTFIVGHITSSGRVTVRAEGVFFHPATSAQ